MNNDEFIAEPSGPAYMVKNRLRPIDEPLHAWYRFVLGYPPHLVREYLDKLGADPERDWVLDPFCGTATTPLEARLQGFRAVGADAMRISELAARVKLAWDIDLEVVRRCLEDTLQVATACLAKCDLTSRPAGHYQVTLGGEPQQPSAEPACSDVGEFLPHQLLAQDARSLIPRGFISDKPLLRVQSLLYGIKENARQLDVHDFMALALANTIVKDASNVAFGPEVYSVPPKDDADVLGAFEKTVRCMISDLEGILVRHPHPFPEARVFRDDARVLETLGACPPIGIVITSPPYPNEKDYTRSTRLENVLLGFFTSKKNLRDAKACLIRSNTRNVFVKDDDDKFIEDIPAVVDVAARIEGERLRLGKTSGFERLYHRVTRLYFGGMYRHFAALFPMLSPGARCAYVVGDQMSYFRVHIKTAQLLADVAIKAGFEVEGIELWRTRRSTVTKLDLDENVLIIRRPGVKGGIHGKAKPQRQIASS